MAGRAAPPQGRKLSNINNMPNRRYLPNINFSVPFARWSHFYVCIDWTKYDHLNFMLGNVYVGAVMNYKSGDKSDVPWFSNGSSLLSPLLSLIAAPT
jgi:hypothetical protein